MYDKILVPTDGSDVAVTAGEAAFSLARQFDAKLYALHVLETDDRTYGDRIVSAIADAAVGLDIKTETAVVDTQTSTHESILDFADEYGVDCIVMGTHSADNVRRFVLGSVATRTLRESPVPVVTVHEETAIAADFETVLVPTDGSECANAAAEHAIAFATETGASIHTIHVVNPVDIGDEKDGALLEALEETGRNAIEDVVHMAKKADVSSVESSVLSGVPHQAIETYVQENDVDYVFMGTHGRTGVSRYLLGSATERVIRLVDVPIVSIKASESVE